MLVAVLVGVLLSVSACTPTTPAGPTTWTFTVKAAYTPAMVARYGGEAALQQKITDQLATVGSRFVGFAATIKLTATEFAQYSGDPFTQAGVAHPNANLQIVYTEDPTVNGGWLGSLQTIVHSWHHQNGSGVEVGDAFIGDANDALTHETGHFRGAIDEYAINVTAANNPVSHTGYQTETSIMDYPYGNTTWSEYTRHIVNTEATTINSPVPTVAVSLPTQYQVNVIDHTGAPVMGATTSVYPVVWYSGAVTATATQTGSTASNGTWTMSNPFQPLAVAGVPWGVADGNFLIQATKNGVTAYDWLPITHVGNWYFNHPGAPYVVTLTVG